MMGLAQYILACSIFLPWNYFCLETIILPMFYVVVVLPYCYSIGDEELRLRGKEEYLSKLHDLICPAWCIGILLPCYSASTALSNGEYIAGLIVLLIAIFIPFGFHLYQLSVRFIGIKSEVGDSLPSFKVVECHEVVLLSPKP